MKKKLLILMKVVILFLAVLSVDNTTHAEAKTVKVKTIQVTNIDYSNFYMMRVGGTLQIKTAVLPQNATNKNITWSSSDQTIAGVSGTGFVTGINPGFCEITGITKDGSNKKVSFYVRVYSEKEFLYYSAWGCDDGKFGSSLYLSSTGEYIETEFTDVDISEDEPSDFGFYSLDTINKTITMTSNYSKNITVWHYTIVSRSKIILSKGTTQKTYTRGYKSKRVTCTSKGLLYMSDASTQLSIIGYKGTDTTLTIPSKISKKDVVWVSSINGNTDIEQIILPDSVTYIENGFKNCTNLKSITLPDSIIGLSSSAFENCVSLETVSLPAGLKTISNQAFKGCTSLKSITLPDQVVSVDSEAFCNCTNLEALYFPKGIKEIEPDILRGCNQVVIYGYKDTCAEDLAKENNLVFIER